MEISYIQIFNLFLQVLILLFQLQFSLTGFVQGWIRRLNELFERDKGFQRIVRNLISFDLILNLTSNRFSHYLLQLQKNNDRQSCWIDLWYHIGKLHYHYQTLDQPHLQINTETITLTANNQNVLSQNQIQIRSTHLGTLQGFQLLPET